MGAILLKGDAMDRTGLDNVFSGVDDIDAVVSTIGGTPANPQADSQVRAHPRLCIVPLSMNGICQTKPKGYIYFAARTGRTLHAC